MKLLISKMSNVGGRSYNEDYCSFTQVGEYYCLAIADGLGGHYGGGVASQIAVETVINSFNLCQEISEEKLVEYLLDAQKAIIKHQDKSRELYNMRTTIAVVLMYKNMAVCAHIGDTRIYYFKNGKIKFQTKDHSVPQAMVNGGDISADQIRFHEDRNRLTRVLGDRNSFRPKIEFLNNIEINDALLLCTDGFWEYITESDMEYDLLASKKPSIWINNMEKRLLSLVKQDNDNYTTLAVFVE